MDFKRTKEVIMPPAELEEQAPVFTPVENDDAETPERNLPMLIALAIAALAFLILLIALATWLYHRSNSPTEKLPAPPPQNLQAS
jgi:hypothetical protein